MATKWRVGEPNTVAVDLGKHDLYNKSGFELLTKYQDEDVPVKQDVTFKEVVETIDDLEVEVAAPVSAGMREIFVKDTSGVREGMRFKVVDKDGNDKNIYFYVSRITPNSIITRKGLEGAIAIDDKLERVGNMGVYEAIFTPLKEGRMTFVVRNPSIGLQNQIAKINVDQAALDIVEGVVVV